MRVYADTSVYGGVFDDEFKDASLKFFDSVRSGRFRLLISPVLVDELRDAPERVRKYFDETARAAEVLDIGEDAIQLQQKYLEAGIVGEKWETDALHVALATVADARMIVSWNFKHIVNYQKIPLYNGVNLANGYAAIAIHSPPEVLADEDEDI